MKNKKILFLLLLIVTLFSSVKVVYATSKEEQGCTHPVYSTGGYSGHYYYCGICGKCSGIEPHSISWVLNCRKQRLSQCVLLLWSVCRSARTFFLLF